MTDAILVCARTDDERPLYFTDDQFGRCSRCLHKIRFRPHAAAINPKVCEVCLPSVIGDDEPVSITDATAAEVLKFFSH